MPATELPDSQKVELLEKWIRDCRFGMTYPANLNCYNECLYWLEKYEKMLEDLTAVQPPIMK